MLKLSTFALVSLAAVAQAEPSSEANDAIKADLRAAQMALELHNTAAVLEAMSDVVKYLARADGETLQAVIVFQNRIRESLTQETELPVSPGVSPPIQVESTLPVPTPSPEFFPEPIPAPAPPDLPSSSEIDVNGMPAPSQQSTPKSGGKIALPGLPGIPEPSGGKARARPSAEAAKGQTQVPQPVPSVPTLIRDAKPSPFENHVETVITITRSGSAREVLQTAPQSQSPQADLPNSIPGQSGSMPGANSRSNRKFLGYYAQDEQDKWVWLPVGSKDCPPPPEAARSDTTVAESSPRLRVFVPLKTSVAPTTRAMNN